MKKYEYCVCSSEILTKEREGELQRLGMEGWELAGIDSLLGRVVFKREAEKADK